MFAYTQHIQCTKYGVLFFLSRLLVFDNISYKIIASWYILKNIAVLFLTQPPRHTSTPNAREKICSFRVNEFHRTYDSIPTDILHKWAKCQIKSKFCLIIVDCLNDICTQHSNTSTMCFSISETLIWFIYSCSMCCCVLLDAIWIVVQFVNVYDLNTIDSFQIVLHAASLISAHNKYFWYEWAQINCVTCVRMCECARRLAFYYNCFFLPPELSSFLFFHPSKSIGR